MAPLRKARTAETARATRRAHGTLESAVLAILWAADGPLSPADVRERLAAHHADDGGDGDGGDGDGGARGDGDRDTGGTGGGDELAYTTVVTILTRLFDKGALSRERDGRAFRYAPVADEAGLAARQLTAMLDAATDRTAVLSRFVEDLGDHDEQLLRGLLDARLQHQVADAE